MKSTHEALVDLLRVCDRLQAHEFIPDATFEKLTGAMSRARKTIDEKKTDQADAVGEGYALSLPAMLDLIDKHLGWVCSDYPRVDDAVYGLQEAVKQAAEVKP